MKELSIILIQIPVLEVVTCISVGKMNRSVSTARGEVQEDDDDIIEILDSPVKQNQDNKHAQTSTKDGPIAPVFNIFNRSEPTSGENRPITSTFKNEADHKLANAPSTPSSALKGKRRQDEFEEDRVSKKFRVDPVKLAQP
jgi:hypothetical protein